MMMKTTMLGVLAFAAVACAPAVQIKGAVAVVPPACAAVATVPLAEGLLDIGFDAASAHSYTAAFSVTASEADITYNAVDVFYTTDEDRGDSHELGQVPGTPVNAESLRHSTIGASSAADIVEVPVVNVGDATLLQAEPFVAETVATGAKARIIANLKLTGTTQGGGAVESQLFTFPLDLCQGCLTTAPNCVDDNGTTDTGDDVPVAPVANPDTCFPGDDVPTLVCP
ncbi:MAG TPA: hypothetical protein VGO62_09875 [Myxococcota bacterium]